jgi:hypothetical protein
MDVLDSDDVATVRDALAVIQTSLHLVRRHLGADAVTSDYLAKHFSRMEKSLERAASALLGE